MRGGSEADVFGPEIAMTLHDAATNKALQQQVFASVDEGFDAARDTLGRVTQGRTAGLQGLAAVVAFGAKAVEINCRSNIHAPRRCKEAGQAVGEGIDVCAAPITPSETMVQHALGGKTHHLDQPVDDDAGTRDREIAPALQGQQHYPDVNAVRKAAVEPHLLLGVAT